MNNLTRRSLFQTTIAAALYGACARRSVAAEAAKTATPRLALEGYDPVAYFTDGRPMKGSSAFSFMFDEALYYFANAEHQRMFAAEPDHYAPQYSGYCAAALSEGFKATVDPEAWAISNGKLYLFHSKKGLAIFTDDPVGVAAKADANWAAWKAQH